MIMHLKKCHGSLTKYNAAKIFDVLSEVKEDRQKSNKQKLSIGDELPQKKQKTISDCQRANALLF